MGVLEDVNARLVDSIGGLTRGIFGWVLIST